MTKSLKHRAVLLLAPALVVGAFMFQAPAVIAAADAVSVINFADATSLSTDATSL